jgi:hypothetical protein
VTSIGARFSYHRGVCGPAEAQETPGAEGARTHSVTWAHRLPPLPLAARRLSMSELTPSAVRWLATHHGVITTKQLRDDKVGRKTQLRLTASGVLRPVYKGVFVITSTPQSLEQRCVALCAAHPAGFVTGPTAGMLLGLRRMPASAALHFSIRHGAKVPPVEGVRFRQTTKLRESDRRDQGDGVVVASWSRLAFDLAADLRPLDHLSALNQLLDDRRVDIDELAAIGKRLAHPGRRGSALFLHNIARLGGRPLDSHPEVMLGEALRARGIPIEYQAPLPRASNGRSAHVDLAVPAVRWGIELDIHPEHRTLDGHASDARRNRDLHRLDWQIEPVTELDMDQVESVARELAALYQLRCVAVSQAQTGVSGASPGTQTPG